MAQLKSIWTLTRLQVEETQFSTLEITNAIEVRITVRYDNHTRSKGVIIRLKDKWQTLGGGGGGRVDIDDN